MFFTRRINFLLVLIILWPRFSDSLAQQNDPINYLNRASQYFLGDKDEILMNVNIWGFVQKPGQYLVPRNTDLIALISFAGGPREGANLGQVAIIRGGNWPGSEDANNGTNGKNHKAPILSVDIKEHLQSGEIGKIPILQAGDTVIINQSFGNKFSRFLGFGSVFGIIAAGASIALIVERL